MKHKKYSESQIAAILKEGTDGVPVPELCRTHDMITAYPA
jgi:putative transposase